MRYLCLIDGELDCFYRLIEYNPEKTNKEEIRSIVCDVINSMPGEWSIEDLDWALKDKVESITESDEVEFLYV